MLLPHALPAHAAAALPGAMGGAVALPSLALAVEANGSSGTQFVDIFYIIGVVGVAAFGFRAVFDSVFAENTEEWVPPIPGKVDMPFGLGGSGNQDPTIEAERLRQKLQAAIEAQDLETAFKTEKALLQFMGENGLFYDPDEMPTQADAGVMGADPPGAIEND